MASCSQVYRQFIKNSKRLCQPLVSLIPDFESDSSLMALVLKTIPETKTQIDSSFSAESLPLYTHLKKLSVKYGANIERNLGVSLKT